MKRIREKRKSVAEETLVEETVVEPEKVVEIKKETTPEVIVKKIIKPKPTKAKKKPKTKTKKKAKKITETIAND